jgi:hypothetical protein
MARGGRRRGDQDGASGAGDGTGELSVAVVESLLQDGYTAEDVAAFYDLPVRRVRRFMRRHGLADPAGDVEEETSATLAPRRWRSEDPFESDWTPPPVPSLGGRAAADKRRGRRLTATQIDELCTLYLDPSLSLGEVASYFDLDQETALALIDEHLTGIVARPAQG